MAAPTAIPHPEASSHYQQQGGHLSVGETQTAGSGLSRSPTNTSPRHMVSPIYTQAGRSSFSLPGPNSSSTSPTTTTWYSAGFASGNSQRVRSPTMPFSSSNTTNNGGGGGGGNVSAITSAVAPQRDSFPDKPPSHFRTASFGSASINSAASIDEPSTPLGRTTSSTGQTQAPLTASYEQMKSRRDSWSFANAHPGNRWSGLASLRERTSANSVPVFVEDGGFGGANDYAAARPPLSGGLLRKFSIGGGQPLKSPPLLGGAQLSNRSAATNTPPASAPVPLPAGTAVQPVVVDNNAALKLPTRGRQGSMSNGSQRRRPSPMGERLLMGHFNAH